MLPECRGPFEFLDLISTGGRQLCKCGNYTIFKPILKNNVRLPVAICYSLSFTSLNHADFGFTNRCCRALCVKGGAGECLISRNPKTFLVNWVIECSTNQAWGTITGEQYLAIGSPSCSIWVEHRLNKVEHCISLGPLWTHQKWSQGSQEAPKRSFLAIFVHV